MQSRWICRCFMVVSSTLAGCQQAETVPATAELDTVPVSESVVVPVRHEVASDAPRVRIHLKMIAIHSRGPFPQELPDLWSSKETSRVFSTDAIQTAVAAADMTGMARCRASADPEVASGQTWDWDLQGSVVGGVTVTPTMGSDGLVQFSFVAHQDQPNTEETTANETKIDLRENETIAIAGPTSHGMCTEISRVPIAGDIPVVGPLFFTARKTFKESKKVLFLLSWETIPR